MKSVSFADTHRSKVIIKRDGSFAKIISFSCDYKLEESTPED
jgi:hypothetical protein